MYWLLISFAILSKGLFAQSAFIPENGRYLYSFEEVSDHLEKVHHPYLKLVSVMKGLPYIYKLDKKRNEYIVKNWFLKDWYLLQKMYNFDPVAFTKAWGGQTFNEAKRRQYKTFAFHKKKYFHYKTVPSLKEWGGLTHPPFHQIGLPLSNFDSSFANLYYKNLSSPYFSADLQQQIDIASKSELTFGNEVHVLEDAKAFQQKMKIVQDAKETILVSSLVFVCDPSTKEFVKKLIAKHKSGVLVKVIVDGFIGKVLGHRECLKEMTKNGIEVLETKDFFKHKLKAIYHTKTLVVDLKVAIAGGHNFIDADNTSRSTDFKNRDIDLLMKGPIVTDVARQFVENWDYQRRYLKQLSHLTDLKEDIRLALKFERQAGARGRDHYKNKLADPETRMKGVCRFIKQAPYEDRHTIGKAYLLLLDKVKSHLVIQDPIKADTLSESFFDKPLAEKWDNFEMFNKLHLKVQSLARKGKKIDYITTNINMAGNENVAIMNERIKEQLEDGKKLLANWSFSKLLLSNNYYGVPHYKNLINDYLPFKNVHVWKHMSFMHSKVFYFDRVVSSVGSYNFQHNATDQAYESTTICMDETLNSELDRVLVEDMANSVPLVFKER